MAVDGEKMKVSDIIRKLNKLGGENGVGILDIVENRLIGMKDHGIYETPGGTILYFAHEQLEMLTLDKETLHMKEKLAVDYADLIYNGKWYSPLQEALTAFAKKSNEYCTGTVKHQALQGQHDQRRHHLAVLPLLREPRHLRRERFRPGRSRRLHQHLGPAHQSPGPAGTGKAVSSHPNPCLPL